MAPLRRRGPGRAPALLCAATAAITGCAGAPLVPYSTNAPPLILVPATLAGVHDDRGRFRAIYCAVLTARAGELPDLRPCDDALTRLGSEPADSGRPVSLGESRRLVNTRMKRELGVMLRHPTVADGLAERR